MTTQHSARQNPQPAEPDLVILHHGQHYIVRQVICDSTSDVIVSFEYWKPQPTLEGEFAGESFFRGRGLNAIGVMAARNDWYQHDEIEQVIAAIRAATPSQRRIGYGGSMGGYAVINFADLLGLSWLVAVIPQFSIDPAKVPFETRWRHEAAAIEFRHDRIESVPRLTQGWIVYDPWCSDDNQHARLIQRYHVLSECHPHFGGHHQFLMLQQADMFSQMLLDMFAGHFDYPAFIRAFRSARRNSASFWLGLGGNLAWRNRIAAAREALARARALPHPEPQGFDDLQAAILAAETHYAQALMPPPLSEYIEKAIISPVPPLPRPLWRRVAGRLRRMLLG